MKGLYHQFTLKPVVGTSLTNWFISLIILIMILPGVTLAQAPTISYATPQTYMAGIAITPLTPTTSNVAAYGYSSSTVAMSPTFPVSIGVALDTAGNIYVGNSASNT